MARKIRPSTLKRMSGDQLKKAGYVRIPGFTKKDGTKVKSHIRMLNPAKGGKEVSKQLAEFAIDMTPIIGDIKAFKEAKDAFSQGDIGSGFLLAGAGTIGLVPGVGDAIAAPIKMLAKSLKKVKLSPVTVKRVEIRDEYLKEYGPDVGDVDVYIHNSYAKNLDIDSFNYRAIGSKAKRGYGEGKGIFTHSGVQDLSGYGDEAYAVVVNRRAKTFTQNIDEATDVSETFIKIADVEEIRYLGKTVDIGKSAKVTVAPKAASAIGDVEGLAIKRFASKGVIVSAKEHKAIMNNPVTKSIRDDINKIDVELPKARVDLKAVNKTIKNLTKERELKRTVYYRAKSDASVTRLVKKENTRKFHSYDKYSTTRVAPLSPQGKAAGERLGKISDSLFKNKQKAGVLRNTIKTLKNREKEIMEIINKL